MKKFYLECTFYIYFGLTKYDLGVYWNVHHLDN